MVYICWDFMRWEYRLAGRFMVTDLKLARQILTTLIRDYGPETHWIDETQPTVH